MQQPLKDSIRWKINEAASVASFLVVIIDVRERVWFNDFSWPLLALLIEPTLKSQFYENQILIINKLQR